MHHIVSDGSSMSIFVKELSCLYQAFSHGEPSPLSEPPIQYADFALWQRNWLQGQVLERQLSYWKQQLAGAPPGLDLPMDRPHPVLQTFRGASHTVLLPSAIADRLRAFSRENRATLFMTLLAAFQILLHRHTGQNDVVVGTPIAGRNRAEIEGLIGFFVNTLVLRTDLSGNPTVAELLARTRATSLAAYAHQDLPFEKLVEELQPERDLSRTPLFQVFFNMLTLDDSDFELDAVSVERVTETEPESKFDLTLYVREKGHQVFLKLVYNADLFNSKRTLEILEQYRSLLSQIVHHPQGRILSLSLVTAQAKELLPDPTTSLRSEWQGPVHARFIEQARRVPDRIAVRGAGIGWRYQELESLSNRLANYLVTKGVGAGDVVAIYACRSACLVWALLGILKAGAAFLILDAAYPAARLATYLRKAQTRGWIAIQEAGVPPNELGDVLATLPLRARLEVSASDQSRCSPSLAGVSDTAPAAAVGPESLAYIAFTSGTAGQPKAIQGTHAPLSHFLAWHSDTFGLRDTDRFSMLSGLAHDPLLRDIFTPLWLGATLCIPDSDSLAFGNLLPWLAKNQISVAHLTPALAELLTENQNAPISSQLPLRFAFFGGDVLTRRHVTQMRSLAPSVICVNFYGATETPQAMAYLIVTPQDPTDEEERLLPQSVPLGRPIADVQLLIVNASRQLCGIGEVGEIYIRTPFLAKGYIGEEATNQERFVTNPFTLSPVDRVYRTGDLGRYTPDGIVEFAGRHDQQVKIRGFRVEPAEIEAVLQQHSNIRRAVIDARDDPAAGKRLIAYIVAKHEPAPAFEDLRGFLRKQLPEYMVASAFVVVNELPLTPNGKVDRHALPTPESGGNANGFLAPRDGVELEIAKVWGQVLGVPSIGVRDNFFDVGGHSLLAARLFAQLEKVFSKKLPLATLFQAPTVEHLANLLRDENWAPSWRSLVPIQPNGPRPPLFCVHAHRGNVVNFNNLARRLGADQPFYGLQAQGLDGTRPRHATIEEMAEHYIDEIRSVQPKGPYLLAGLCFGGKVAFEMAHQFLARGEKVALLAIIDAYAPGNPKLLPWGQRRKAQAKLHWSNLNKLTPAEKLNYIKAKRKIAEAKSAAAIKKIAARSFHGLGLSVPAALQSISGRKRRIQYTPSVYPGRIDVFAPSEAHSVCHVYEAGMGWDRFVAGGLEIHVIPGKFASIILEPSVQELAERLRATIDKSLGNLR
jgi:amino acid adenylation domain-containing protein